MIDAPRATITKNLFSGLLDDASLFPPANTDMPRALRAHATNRLDRDGFMQGPFVVPAGRLAEMFAARATGALPRRHSVLVEYTALERDLAALESARADMDADDAIVAIEMRLPPGATGTPALQLACERIDALCVALPVLYLEAGEPPAEPEPERLAATVLGLRSRVPNAVYAKLRCGGVTENALPPAQSVARFVLAMRAAGVAWKATAGLHHALRGVYGGRMMHGFLNLVAASLVARTANTSHGALSVILEDEDPAHFKLTDFAFAWRGAAFDADAIAEMRDNALQSIGSCSFEEPVHDLRALRMLT